MRSMTGYGSFQSPPRKGPPRERQGDFQIEVTVKALNGRFLESRFQLPVHYAALEGELKNILQKYFSRGRIEVFVRRRQGPSNPNLKAIVKSEVARLWIEGYKELGAELKLLAEPTLDMVVRLPDVITFEETMNVTTNEERVLFDTFEQACKKCQKEREREGEMIRVELLALTKNLEKKVKGILSLRRQGNDALKKNLLKRLGELGFGNAKSDPRFIQEAALLVEKYDITEEVVRLREHVEVFRAVVREGGVQGKKLDFYTQELLREANTIGSKSQVIKLTELVVEAKAIIERLKEQVQNVE